MSALENETLHETTTFEHFGRSWTVPTRRHLSHIKRMRDELKSGVGSVDLMLAETFLSADEFNALLEIDPDEVQLDEFTDQIAKALGTGGSGNSSPSSAS